MRLSPAQAKTLAMIAKEHTRAFGRYGSFWINDGLYTSVIHSKTAFFLVRNGLIESTECREGGTKDYRLTPTGLEALKEYQNGSR